MATSTVPQQFSGPAAYPGRLQLIQTTHQQLEDALDTLQAYTGAAMKLQAAAKDTTSGGGFSPWAGAQASAASCVEAASRCLRLFRPARQVPRLSNAPTLAALYGGDAAAPARVRAFVGTVMARYPAGLPMELALSAGRHLQRLDHSSADEFLYAAITGYLNPPDNADNVTKRRCEEMLATQTNSPAWRAHLRGLLLLQLESAAAAGHEAHKLVHYNTAKLQAAITTPVYEELSRYEVACCRAADREREEAAALKSPPPASVTPSIRTGFTQPVARADARAPAAPSYLFAHSGWRSPALKVGLLLLLLVILRITAGPLARALKAVLSVTHSTQARRRTLTL